MLELAAEKFKGEENLFTLQKNNVATFKLDEELLDGKTQLKVEDLRSAC